MPNQRVHIVVEGRVQGVFFRACTEEEARCLGLVGWVRNRPDRSVEAIIEGKPEKVAAMIRWLHQGSPQATVTRVRVTEEPPSNDCNDFTIHY